MAGVDNRIVTMKFDNAQFEQGARTSMSTLQKLKEGMNFGTVGDAATKSIGGITALFSKFGVKNPFSTAEKGAADLGKAADAVTTGGLTSLDGAVTGVSTRFLAMSTIAITALSSITNRALAAGQSITSALTVDPIKLGLEEYELNMNSIQTILANTQVSGADLGDVNSALDELNEYSDKTIYNFSEMAKNIGTFTAAGVDLDTSVSSIKGIANLAALSGSNSQQAATAMYQLSQEISAGRVSLMGWNSVVNAGMGGTTFQRALAQTAVAQGDIAESAVKLEGKMKNVVVNGQSFRDSIMAKPGEQSWLSSDVLLKTLKQFTGDMSDAELKAQGFNAQQIKDIQTMAKTAQDAATKVKTLKQVYDVAKETAQSGWSQSFRLIFGDFEEAKELFTDFSNFVNGFLGRSADARNELLGDWKELGGRDLLIESFKNLGSAVLGIVRPIKRAMEDIFPPTTGLQLALLTKNFADFTKGLIPSRSTMKDIREIAQGFFAVLDIGRMILVGAGEGLKILFGALGTGDGKFLGFAVTVSEAIQNFRKFLKETDLITTFFTTLGGILSVPIRLISEFAGILGRMFSSFDAGGAGGAIGAMEGFGGAADKLASGADRVMSVFKGISDIIGGVGELIVNGLANIGEFIAGAISPETFDRTLDVINTALLGGIVLMLKRFFSGGINLNFGGSDGFLSSVTDTLDSATGVLQNMQANLKADILLKIAGALAILAASLFVLSTIDSGDLTKALVAMGIGFAAMQVALVSLNTAIGVVGAAKLPFIAGAMVLLATSLLIFAGAMKILGDMELSEIARALVAIGGLLFVLNKAMKPLAAGAGGMIRAAIAITILGVALNILAMAMKIFATFKWEEMAKGLVGVVGSLSAIAIAMKLMPKGILLQAAAILILSVALNALGGAMKIFATMDWTEMGKGLAGIAGALVIIAAAMRLMPKGMLLQAVALNAVAAALVVLSGALKVMGGMSWEEIGKGLVTLGGAMLILAVGLNLMTGTLMGAAALVVTAGALAILVPVLATLGNLSVGTIVTSLLTLVAVFTILGVAGLLLAPLTPVIIGLGAAMVLFGAGLALAGAGALAAATAFAIVVGAGAAGVTVLGKLLAAVIAAIPAAMAAFGRGIVSFLKVITKNGPAFTDAMDTIMSSMLKSAEKNIPRAGRVFMEFIDTCIKVLRSDGIPQMVEAGFDLVIGVLEGIAKKLPGVIKAAADVAVAFIRGIGRESGRIADAGFKALIDFIRGLEKAVRENDQDMIDAGLDLADAIGDGIIEGFRQMGDRVKDAAVDMAKGALANVRDFLGVNSPSRVFRDQVGKPVGEGMALGIDQSTGMVVASARRMGKTSLDTLTSSMAGISDALSVDPNMTPTVTPVLDLTTLTKEASKMSGILATAPIVPGVSYQTAAHISALTQASAEAEDGPDAPGSGGGGDTYHHYEQHLHSPKPIDSVEAYRGGKTLISLAKEAVT